MKLTAAFISVFLHLYTAEARSATSSPNEVVVPSSIAARTLIPTHARNFVRLSGRDCGKFVFKCKDAEGACNNACFHINCVDPSTRKMVFDSSNSNDENRKQSGCKAGGKSICNQMPFSQRFHDPFNKDPGDQKINCDEWPMATIKQTPFKEGTIRNSLRCIPRGENGSGGVKLQNFLQGKGNQPGRTCTGKIRNNDYWTVEFDTDGADHTNLGYCLQPQNCAQDVYEFHMTKLRNAMHFPLDVDRDNMYTATGNDAEIYQCSVIVNRQGDESLSAEVYNEKGEQKGRATAGLGSTNDALTVRGLPRDLNIFRTGPLGSKVDFAYGGHDFQHYDFWNDFAWFSDSKGSSKSFKPDGSYCLVGEVNGLHDTQYIKCYFPCGPK